MSAFTWVKLSCEQCGAYSPLLQREDGKIMCLRCYQDHFEEENENVSEAE